MNRRRSPEAILLHLLDRFLCVFCAPVECEYESRDSHKPFSHLPASRARVRSTICKKLAPRADPKGTNASGYGSPGTWSHTRRSVILIALASTSTPRRIACLESSP